MMQMVEDTLTEHAHTKPLPPHQLILYREFQVPNCESFPKYAFMSNKNALFFLLKVLQWKQIVPTRKAFIAATSVLAIQAN